jgi:hypothetical protein
MDSKKIFNEFNITLAVQDQFNIKTLITANHKEKELYNRKYGIYSIKCQDCNINKY